MKALCAGLLFLLLSQTGAFADKPPVLRYLGEWSDGRGEVMLVTTNTIRMGSHLATFKEISRSPDLRVFCFRLTSSTGGFDGRYLNVEVSREELRMRTYRTLEDCKDSKSATAVVSWERDR